MPATDGAALLHRIGARVRARRQNQGLTLKSLAAQCGLSARFLSEVEQGRANIAVTRLDNLASSLGVPLVDLVSPSPRVITLLGVRGAGKTSVGSRLAGVLGVPFIELVDQVEAAADMPLADIFSLGHAYYPRLERESLDRVLDARRPCVIALPGGIVERDALDRIRRDSFSVWLKASPEDLWSRVFAQGDTRPMAGRPDAMAELRSLLGRREPQYRQCDLTIDTSATLPDDAAGAIASAVTTSTGT